jgi:hypothetical protein
MTKTALGQVIRASKSQKILNVNVIGLRVTETSSNSRHDCCARLFDNITVRQYTKFLAQNQKQVIKQPDKEIAFSKSVRTRIPRLPRGLLSPHAVMPPFR